MPTLSSCPTGRVCQKYATIIKPRSLPQTVKRPRHRYLLTVQWIRTLRSRNGQIPSRWGQVLYCSRTQLAAHAVAIKNKSKKKAFFITATVLLLTLSPFQAREFFHSGARRWETLWYSFVSFRQHTIRQHMCTYISCECVGTWCREPTRDLSRFCTNTTFSYRWNIKHD